MIAAAVAPDVMKHTARSGKKKELGSQPTTYRRCRDYIYKVDGAFFFSSRDSLAPFRRKCSCPHDSLYVTMWYLERKNLEIVVVETCGAVSKLTQVQLCRLF